MAEVTSGRLCEASTRSSVFSDTSVMPPISSSLWLLHGGGRQDKTQATYVLAVVSRIGGGGESLTFVSKNLEKRIGLPFGKRQNSKVGKGDKLHS